MSPTQVVQTQLDAFNAKDIDAFAATYAEDAEQFTLHGERLAQGLGQIRNRYVERFKEPALHARLLSRTVVGNVVVDAEIVTRSFPEGLGTVEILCIYEVIEDKIRKASFAQSQITRIVAP